MVKEEDGISMLALSHNKYNDRAAHMGHPSSDLRYDSNSDSDSEGRCLENNAVGDGDRDREEIENVSDSERDEDEDEDGGEEDEGFIWALYIPLRLAAVIIGLQLACSSEENIIEDHFTSISISLQYFQKMMEKKRIFPDEVRIFLFGSNIFLNFKIFFCLVIFFLFLFHYFLFYTLCLYNGFRNNNLNTFSLLKYSGQ